MICLSVVKSIGEETRKESRGYYEETQKGAELDPDERSAKRRRVERERRFDVKFEVDNDSY